MQNPCPMFSCLPVPAIPPNIGSHSSIYRNHFVTWPSFFPNYPDSSLKTVLYHLLFSSLLTGPYFCPISISYLNSWTNYFLLLFLWSSKSTF